MMAEAREQYEAEVAQSPPFPAHVNIGTPTVVLPSWLQSWGEGEIWKRVRRDLLLWHPSITRTLFYFSFEA